MTLEITSQELQMLQQATALLYAKRVNKSVKMYPTGRKANGNYGKEREALQESADETMRLLVKLGNTQ